MEDFDSDLFSQLKAEQKSSCHLADPPLLAEIASYLVRNNVMHSVACFTAHCSN